LIISIKYIEVKPEARGKGVGKALYKSLLKEFSEGKIDPGGMTTEGLHLWNSVKTSIPKDRIYDRAEEDKKQKEFDEKCNCELPGCPECGKVAATFLTKASAINDNLPLAKAVVDGRKVLKGPIPNMDSISATLDNYDILKGVREIGMDNFNYSPPYSTSELKRTKDLAEKIKASNKIMPLIVVQDSEGFYILEGGHRFDALHMLGAKSFPAIIVKDLNGKIASQTIKAYVAVVEPTTKVMSFLNKVTAKLVLKSYDEYAHLVSDAYLALPKYEAEYVPSWKALAANLKTLYKRLQSQFTFEFTDEDPYKSYEEMKKDVKKTGVLKIYKGHSEHPVWTPEENHLFRAVHDAMGHLAGYQKNKGHAFNLRGELGVYNRTTKLVSKSAQLALFTEVVGQACTSIVTGDFPTQKICKLKGFDYTYVGKVDDAEYALNFPQKEQKLAASFLSRVEAKSIPLVAKAVLKKQEVKGTNKLLPHKMEDLKTSSVQP